MTETGLRPALFSACVLLGCSAGGEAPPLVVGTAGGGNGGFGTGGTLALPGGTTSATFSAHIESPPGVTVELITLACSNDCADVLAVARGGFPPYSYVWEDGSTEPARRVCPTVDASYRVTATDTGSQSTEFRRDPQSRTARLTAQILNCPPDGGARPPDADGGSRDVCLINGTFAGTPQLNFAVNFDAPPWVACASTPDVYDAALSSLAFGALGLAPADGNTALHAISSIPSESVAQKLCSPLRAGTTYHLRMDLYSPVGSSISPVSVKLDIWGSATSCGKDQLLWTSPSPTPSWGSYCATFTPTQDVTHLMLEPHFETSESAVFVDNVAPVDACP